MLTAVSREVGFQYSLPVAVWQAGSRWKPLRFILLILMLGKGLIYS